MSSLHLIIEASPYPVNMSEPLKTEKKVEEQQIVAEEKNIVSAEHIDNKPPPSVNEVDLKDGVHRDLDQFGAWAKSDPREIALVKKVSNPQYLIHRGCS